MLQENEIHKYDIAPSEARLGGGIPLCFCFIRQQPQPQPLPYEPQPELQVSARTTRIAMMTQIRHSLLLKNPQRQLLFMVYLQFFSEDYPSSISYYVAAPRRVMDFVEKAVDFRQKIYYNMYIIYM